MVKIASAGGAVFCSCIRINGFSNWFCFSSLPGNAKLCFPRHGSKWKKYFIPQTSCPLLMCPSPVFPEQLVLLNQSASFSFIHNNLFWKLLWMYPLQNTFFYRNDDFPSWLAVSMGSSSFGKRCCCCHSFLPVSLLSCLELFNTV